MKGSVFSSLASAKALFIHIHMFTIGYKNFLISLCHITKI